MPDALDPNDREILFVKETNKQIVVWEGKKLSKARAREVSGIKCVEWIHSFENFLHRMMPHAEQVYLATNDEEHLRASMVVENGNA